MRTVRNITVAVEPELYRQTRRIAAEYDATVNDMVRFLLLVLPEAAKAARYPGGRPQFGLAMAARDARSASEAKPAPAPANLPNPPMQSDPATGTFKIAPCTPVNAGQPDCLQQLASLQLLPVQDKYSRIRALKALISKLL